MKRRQFMQNVVVALGAASVAGVSAAEQLANQLSVQPRHPDLITRRFLVTRGKQDLGVLPMKDLQKGDLITVVSQPGDAQNNAHYVVAEDPAPLPEKDRYTCGDYVVQVEDIQPC